MTHTIEAVIQVDLKEVGYCYYVVPSPSKGLFARCGSYIENPETDSMWQQIKHYAKDANDLGEATRLLITTEKECVPYNPVTITAIEELAD